MKKLLKTTKGNTLVITIMITMFLTVIAAVCFSVVYKFAVSSENRVDDLRYSINSNYSIGIDSSGGN